MNVQRLVQRARSSGLEFAEVVAVLVTACASSNAFAETPKSAFTADSIINIEAVGAGIFDPSGRYFLFEKAPPMKDWPSFSETFDPSASHRTGKIYIYDRHRAGPIRLPFPERPDTGYWLGRFSPDGRSFYYFEDRKGHVKLCIYNLRTRTPSKVAGTPAISSMFDILDRTPVWADSKTLIFASTMKSSPIEAEDRRLISASLNTLWQKAWRGKSASATAVSSDPAHRSSSQDDGALIKVDLAKHRESRLLLGRFSEIELSPDRRYVAALQEEAAPPFPQRGNLGIYWDRIRTKLVVVDLADGRAVKLEPTIAIPGSLRWAPQGDRLSFYGYPARDSSAQKQLRILHIRSRTTTTVITSGLKLVSEAENGLSDRPVGDIWLGNRLLVLATNIGELALNDPGKNGEQHDR
ncbi:MAG TPA: hypothetical protein VJ846_02165, partial [Sphingomicrobium sp.]|nr:hypothetical protein [Sphingomicrobium sp.]